MLVTAAGKLVTAGMFAAALVVVYSLSEVQLTRVGERPGVMEKNDHPNVVFSDTRDASLPDIVASKQDGSFREHCVVHVHGFHHTGTGFLRASIHDSLKGMASMHGNTASPESEGQHLQHVYPTFRERRFDGLCLDDVASTEEKEKKLGRLYYCPDMLSIAKDPQNRNKLYNQWSRYWNMNNPILLQKTPTFDVLFLERMKVTPTVHALVMRHPFDWHQRVTKDNKLRLPFIWLDVWAHTLELLQSGEIESYVVLNYETLATLHDDVLEELSTIIKDGCGYPRHSELRRRLPFHEGKDVSKYLAHNGHALRIWSRCEQDDLCLELMNDLGPVMSELGYTWDRDASFLPELVDHTKVLFSSQKPPSSELVQKMKALAKKYCE